MNNNDITNLIEHSREDIFKIRKQSENGEINKVNLKNALENLRSVLDYAAKDINVKLASICHKNSRSKVYFPYGQRENHFNKSVNNNLPNLDRFMPEIYDLIINMQPFKSGDNWLVDLCNLTNEAKHNNLNKTQNIESKFIYQGGSPIVRVGHGCSVTMYGNTVDGVLQDDVYIYSDGSAVIKTVSGQTDIIDGNIISFQGKNIEVSPFLETCIFHLSQFIEKLYVELGKV